MGKESNGAWGDLMFVVPLILVAIAVLANVLRCTSRISEIEHAEVIILPWWRVSYGFWWTPQRTNCTVRSGPTVRLTLHNQRIVTITAPKLEAAVAALRDASAGGQAKTRLVPTVSPRAASSRVMVG